MRSGTTDRWLMSAIGVIGTVTTATVLTVRPVPLPEWLPGERQPAQTVPTVTSSALGLPQTFFVTPGDGQITVTWPSGDGTDRYRADAVSEAEAPVSSSCRPVASGSTPNSSCVISELRNGVPYLVTVRPADETETSVPPRVVRAVPRPAVLTSPNTVLWLDPSDYATVKPEHSGVARIGSRVAQLRDKSPHHLDAVQHESGRQPILGQLGRMPALLVDGDDVLLMDGRAFPAGSKPSTVLVVAAQDDLSPEATCFHNLLSWGAGQVGQARILHKGCRTSLAFAETWGTYVDQRPTLPWPNGKAAVLTAVFDPAGTSVRLNGDLSYRWQASAKQRMNTGSLDGARVGGAGWDPAGGWVGRIGEIVVFDRVLSPAELTVVEQYLAAKWQIGLGAH